LALKTPFFISPRPRRVPLWMDQSIAAPLWEGGGSFNHKNAAIYGGVGGCSSGGVGIAGGVVGVEGLCLVDFGGVAAYVKTF